MTEPTDTGLRGPDLLVAVVNHILQHRETWDQKEWHSECGTKHCVAGWTQVMGGQPMDEDCVVDDAEELLGLSYDEANYLFSSDRTLYEIRAFAVNFRDWYYGEGAYAPGAALSPIPPRSCGFPTTSGR
ncbi:MAG TPA: hypothetical protein PJ982_14750 [Lacipirellulaceae bacterium]|nr:hypothetical protein [Lacipirellulaceae bacterium]